MKQSSSQKLVYKISTDRLKRENWDMTLDIDKAKKLEEVIALGDSQFFRFIEKITKDKKEFKKDVIVVVANNKTDFKRACKGFKVNGISFKRFVGTAGGIKKSTIIFVSDMVYDELLIKANNGRDLSKKMNPAKFEAYKALMCSSSTPVTMPKGIVVVEDCVTKFKDRVIHVDDTNSEFPVVNEIHNYDVELTPTDGFGVCTYEYMKQISEDLELDYVLSGANTRFPFEKGMIYPFDIVKFAEEVAGTYTIIDVWGKKHDIRDIQLIMPVSMLKLWDSYDGIRHYLRCCKENGYEFSVSKTTPKELEDVRELNYQYIQSYNMSDEDIYNLIEPTITWLKSSMCGDYKSTLQFIGADVETKLDGNMDFIQALIEDERMMKDPFVVRKVHRLIKKKIDNAKIGKIRCNGNYQIASGDPYILMESVFGLEPKGLLKSGEFYSKYWNDKGSDEILLFRSPMTSHNNIVKGNLVNNDIVNEWYKYMNKVIIFNAWDTTMMAENGEDFDSDTNFTTDNDILLKNHVKLPAIVCVQRSAEKHIITDELLQQSNIDGFGNDVGTITNRVTTMFEVLSKFDKNTKEYEELQYRIICGQLYQQNSIDKIKGIKTTPMSKTWYDKKSCNDEFNKSIVANKKPKFMIYIYPETMKEYTTYTTNSNRKCRMMFNCTINELNSKYEYTNDEYTFLENYYEYMPVGLGECICNKICNIIEKEFEDFPPYKDLEFDYAILKSDTCYTKKQYEDVKKVYEEYQERVRIFQSKSKIHRISKEDSIRNREMFKDEFKQKASIACKNKKQLSNIVIDLCYSNNNSKQFAWDVMYDEIIDNLRRNK